MDGETLFIVEDDYHSSSQPEEMAEIELKTDNLDDTIESSDEITQCATKKTINEDTSTFEVVETADSVAQPKVVENSSCAGDSVLKKEMGSKSLRKPVASKTSFTSKKRKYVKRSNPLKKSNKIEATVEIVPANMSESVYEFDDELVATPKTQSQPYTKPALEGDSIETSIKAPEDISDKCSRPLSNIVGELPAFQPSTSKSTCSKSASSKWTPSKLIPSNSTPSILEPLKETPTKLISSKEKQAKVSMASAKKRRTSSVKIKKPKTPKTNKAATRRSRRNQKSCEPGEQQPETIIDATSQETELLAPLKTKPIKKVRSKSLLGKPKSVLRQTGSKKPTTKIDLNEKIEDNGNMLKTIKTENPFTNKGVLKDLVSNLAQEINKLKAICENIQQHFVEETYEFYG